MGIELDRRVNAFRDDLADERLRGQVAAPRFSRGQDRCVVEGVVELHRRPGEAEAVDSVALFGERVKVFEELEGWCWVQLEQDGYVGYLRGDALAVPVAPRSTHRVAVLSTLLFSEPDIKAARPLGLPRNAALSPCGHVGRFCELASGGFVIADHISPIENAAGDFVAIAAQFAGTPYLWGGKSHLGIDCSGLVQTSLQAVGIACPRDSDMQEREVGEPAGSWPPADLRRADLIFWPGHVAIALDSETILHANAHHMCCVSEPVSEAVARIAGTPSGYPTTIRRIRTR